MAQITSESQSLSEARRGSLDQIIKSSEVSRRPDTDSSVATSYLLNYALRNARQYSCTGQQLLLHTQPVRFLVRWTLRYRQANLAQWWGRRN